MDDQLARLHTEAVALLRDLDSRQTQMSPTARPGKWSIQQVVEHLLMTYGLTSEVMSARLAKGRPTQASATFGQRAGQFSICTLGIFPPGFSAPAAVTPSMPSTVRTGAELSERMGSDLARMDASIDDAEKMFGQRKAVSHARLGPLSVAQWRRFHAVHGRHHLKQIRTIRKDHGV